MISAFASNISGLRALVADDHGLYRAGLSLLLRDECGFENVREASSLGEAASIMDQGDEFNLALFDLFMPGMSGPGSLKTMRSNSPKTRFAVISASQDRRDIIATISAGLNGFIPKSLPDGDIAGAIRIILGSQIYVPGQLAGSCSQPSLATSPTERLSRLSSDFVSGQTPDLTPRQRDVLEAVRQGLTNKEIARNLAIAEGTVKIHLAGLFAAFGVRNRTELAVCN